jgi:hypothetical protein
VLEGVSKIGSALTEGTDRGVSARAGEGLGDRDADASAVGAAGPQAKKRMSNKEWKSPSHGDARIAKMKDERTHLANKAEHAVDVDTRAR